MSMRFESPPASAGAGRKEWRRRRLGGLLSWVALGGAFLPATALAQTAPPVLDSGDTAWMLTATSLVLMMTIPGLVMFYGGLVRKKNVLSMAVQSFATCCLITVVWTVAGYSLVFGEGGGVIGGLDRIFLTGMSADSLVGTVPESVFVTFQMTFAIITPALIIGAYADRMKFSAMLVFNAAWVLVVYAPIAHWVWGGGFLGSAGVLDFAGGMVVHVNAGVAGLVASLMIGRRLRYGTEPFAPHSMVISVVGASLLWVGWFGFNAGSAVAANGSAGMAMIVTQIATAGAGLSWMFTDWVRHRKPSALGIISGAVAGLVAITPAAGFVGPAGALAIGVVAGIVCYWGVTTLKRRFGYDDALDAFGIHGLGGIVGALLTGVFAVESVGGKPGLIEGNAGQVLTQAYGLAVTMAYCAVVTWILLKVIDLLLGLRVDEKVETVGLDISLHGERGYEL